MNVPRAETVPHPAESDVQAGADPIAAGNHDILWLAILAACASIAAFAYYFRHDAILLYGDATAHINIARRLFDSRTPGPFQLGTVWLPLPHLLIAPFVVSNWMWRSGFGGSIPSMVAYVLGTMAIFRLVGRALPDSTAARVAAWCAALVYAANPNLLYLQATAMNEPLYLAFFLWATVFFSEFVRQTRAPQTLPDARRSLRRSAAMLLCAMLCRYDGWFAAAAFAVAALAVVWHWTGGRIALWRSPLRPAFTHFVLILAVAPVSWFAWNALIWGNPLEFATGPYSARAIEARSSGGSGFHHPGYERPGTALRYFVKDSKLIVAGGDLTPEYGTQRRIRMQNVWLGLAIAGSLLLVVSAPGAWPWLLLWVPLPFYVLSIAWGGVPIFIPVWWPYSYYNVRYGLALLPAFAVLSAAVVYVVARRSRSTATLGAVGAAFIVLLTAAYAGTWTATPLCLREARANSATRLPFELKLAAELKTLPPTATLLMYTAANAGALERAGIPLRRTINETNFRLWDQALAFPARFADYLVATDGDPVAKTAREHSDEFEPAAIIQMPGQRRTTLFRKRPPA